MTQVDPDNEATFRVRTVPSDPEAAGQPKDEILDELRACGFTRDETFAVKLALEEAFSNALKHGNRGDCSKCITVRYAVTPEKAVIVVRDEGCGFEPEAVPDPTHPDRLPLPNGRGIMLMRAYMDSVEYRDRGREVYMCKVRKVGA